MDIQTFLTNICQHSGIDAESIAVEISESANAITATIKVPQEESGLLIGFHGETLSALQRISRVVFQEELQDKRLIVNVNEYREQRTDRLQQMAQKAAQQVLETGRPYRFSYLPSHERFVIHATIGEDPTFAELETVSQGEGRERVLVVRFKETQEMNSADSTSDTEVALETTPSTQE